MRAILITIGDEIVSGDTLNRDLSIISKFLSRYGLELEKEVSVKDREDDIVKEIRTALTEFDLIFTTGGLGPTHDDITRAAVAKAISRKLVFSEELWEKIKERIEKRGVEPKEIHRNYGYIIEGFEPIENDAGIAPGLYGRVDSRELFILPGPPRELISTLNKLKDRFEEKRTCYKGELLVRTFGLREAEIAELMKPYEEELKPYGSYPSLFGVDIKLVASAKNEEEVQRSLEERKNILKRILGDNIYGYNQDTMEKVVGNLLRAKKMTVATAESCTGGLVANMITDVPGSSDYFIGSVVAYHNRIKESMLSVPMEILEYFGAVSEPTALLMAEGVRKLYNVDVGLSTTGIAGPTGGTPEKPVGLVYMAVSIRGRKRVIRKIFEGNRLEVKKQTALTVLDLLRRMLLED